VEAVGEDRTLSLSLLSICGSSISREAGYPGWMDGMDRL